MSESAKAAAIAALNMALTYVPKNKIAKIEEAIGLLQSK